VALLGLAMLGAATTTNYVLGYMTTYASTALGMPFQLSRTPTGHGRSDGARAVYHCVG
jgi:hypothetical protein